MEQAKILVFTDLRVWQAAHELVLQTYKLSKDFPKEEVFGLTSQMRRAAVSITSNIAEGFGRKSNAEKLRFYNIAYASGVELQNQMFIARDLGYVPGENVKQWLEKSEGIQKQMNALMGAIPTTNY